MAPGLNNFPGITWPANGSLEAVCLILLTPQHKAGMRVDPAISVATPNTLPLIATSAASPPDEPPAVNDRLWGFSVRPKI